MLKKILIATIPLIALAFIVFAWLKIDQKQQNQIHASDFFDENAIVKGRINDLVDFFRGENREGSHFISKLPVSNPLLDLANQWDKNAPLSDWNSVFGNEELHFAVYSTGNTNEIIWVLQSSEGFEKKFTRINEIFLNNEASVENTGEKQFQVYINKNTWFIQEFNNFILFSLNHELVKESINRANSGKASNKNLKSSEYAEMNWRINKKSLNKLLDESFQLKKYTQWTQNLTSKIEVDFHFKKKGLYLSVLTDSSNLFLKELHDNLNPTTSKQIKILPQKATHFFWLNFKNEGYHRYYDKVLKNQLDLSNPELSFEYLKWIEGEMTFFNMGQHNFLMISNQFSSYDPISVLEELNIKNSGLHVDSLENFDYSSYNVKKLYSGEKFSSYFPEFLINQPIQWYTEIDNQIIFSDDRNMMTQYIDQFTSQSFLLNENVIENQIVPFHGDKIPFLFWSPMQFEKEQHPFGEWYLSHFAQMDKSLFWSSKNQKNKETLNHFSWTHNNNTQSNDSSDVDWEITLDYTPTGNYITYYDAGNGNMMLIEGDDQHLHFVNSKGTEIKRVQLSGLLVGNPQFISANKGKEKCLMFNTENDVYLTDLKGNIYSGFPYKSNIKISGTARIFDYENDGNLRVIVPLSNGEVKNIDKKGSIVEGWIMKKVNEKFVSYPRHFIREGKDYLCFFTQSQKLYAVDRRGELRPDFPFDFSGWTGGDVKLSPASTIDESYIRYISQQGQLKRIYFSGKKDSIALENSEKHYTWDFNDLTGDGKSEFIATRSGYITVYNDIGIEIFSYPTNVIKLHSLQVIKKNKIENYLGYILKDKEQLILIDPFGELKKGYPKDASNLFLTIDVNGDNERELVYFNKNQLICTKNW